MLYQITLADALDQVHEPIGIGDYVEHISKPGLPLLVVRAPYPTKTNHICIDVRKADGRVLPVYLTNVRRC